MDEAAVTQVLKEHIIKAGVLADDLDDDTVEYIVGTLVEGGEREDLVEAVAPFLLDMGCVEEEEAAAALAAQILDALEAAGEPAAEADDGGPQVSEPLTRTSHGASIWAVRVVALMRGPKVLENRVILSAGVEEEAAKIARNLGTMLDKEATMKINKEIKVWGDGGFSEEDLSDKQIRELLKKRKRDDKKFQKDMRFVKASAERRAILIDALKTKPVIIHRDATCSTVPEPPPSGSRAPDPCPGVWADRAHYGIPVWRVSEPWGWGPDAEHKPEMHRKLPIRVLTLAQSLGQPCECYWAGAGPQLRERVDGPGRQGAAGGRDLLDRLGPAVRVIFSRLCGGCMAVLKI
jgi:hypothetical protein